MDPLESAAFGLALGFSLAAPPGPMNALIAAASTRSARAGTLTGLGAMTADLLLGAVVLSVSTWIDLRPIVRPVDAVGAVAMAYFGVRLLRRWDEALPAVGADSRTFSQALAFGLGNPFQVLWWLTAGLAFARLGGVVLLGGLFGAIAVWIVVFPTAVHAGVQRRPGLGRAIALASGAILLAFAAYFALLAVGA